MSIVDDHRTKIVSVGASGLGCMPKKTCKPCSARCRSAACVKIDHSALAVEAPDSQHHFYTSQLSAPLHFRTIQTQPPSPLHCHRSKSLSCIRISLRLKRGLTEGSLYRANTQASGSVGVSPASRSAASSSCCTSAHLGVAHGWGTHNTCVVQQGCVGPSHVTGWTQQDGFAPSETCMPSGSLVRWRVQCMLQ